MAVQSNYPAGGSKISSSWLHWAGIILGIWLAASIVAGVVFGQIINYGKRREARRRQMLGQAPDDYQPDDAPAHGDVAGTDDGKGPQAEQNFSKK